MLTMLRVDTQRNDYSTIQFRSPALVHRWQVWVFGICSPFGSLCDVADWHRYLGPDEDNDSRDWLLLDSSVTDLLVLRRCEQPEF